MEKGKTIISVSGYGATGSSAVVDLLKLYKEIEVLDKFEFQFLYFPDAIRDLDYKLNEVYSRFYDSDVGITRFLNVSKKLDEWYSTSFHGHLYELAQGYIDSLNPVKWEGYWAYDRLSISEEERSNIDAINASIQKHNRRIQLLNRFLRKAGLSPVEEKPSVEMFRSRTMYQCTKPEHFLEKTRDFTDKLLAMGCSTNAPFVAINQLLPPNHPSDYYKYFSGVVKSIVTTRDPRDIFIHANLFKWHVVPYYDANVFVKWYRDTFRPEINTHDESVLFFQYEDLIYEFESTEQRIRTFLGVSSPDKSRGGFDPHVSVFNTQLFKRYPEYNDSMEVIERELSDFLYDFDNHKDVECVTNTIIP